jgi:hypothetical protein
MRAGKIDRRTAPAKAFERVVSVLAADWPGGLDGMPGTARLLVDRLGVLTVRLMLREQRLMREAAHGVDDASSDKHTIALHNAFRRSIEAFELMRERERTSNGNGPSLGEYLHQRDAERCAATHTGGDGSSHAEFPTRNPEAPG